MLYTGLAEITYVLHTYASMGLAHKTCTRLRAEAMQYAVSMGW